MMEGSVEKRLADLFSRYSMPPLDVIVPMLEERGRGEQELRATIYDAYIHIAEEMMRILALDENSMKSLAKVWEVATGFEGGRMVPIELTETRFSFSIPDCPMLHVGKRVGPDVKSRFCDIVCSNGSRALMDAVLSPSKGTCTWNKALIRGERKCTVVFELEKPR